MVDDGACGLLKPWAYTQPNLRRLLPPHLQGATPNNRQGSACIQRRLNCSLDYRRPGSAGESHSIQTRNHRKRKSFWLFPLRSRADRGVDRQPDFKGGHVPSKMQGCIAYPLTGVPRSKEIAPPEDATEGPYLGPDGGPMGGGAISYERGTPVVAIRKEAVSFYRTISGVRLFWELEEPEGP